MRDWLENVNNEEEAEKSDNGYFDIVITYNGFDLCTWHKAYIDFECAEYFKVYSEIRDTYQSYYKCDNKRKYSYRVEKSK